MMMYTCNWCSWCVSCNAIQNLYCIRRGSCVRTTMTWSEIRAGLETSTSSVSAGRRQKVKQAQKPKADAIETWRVIIHCEGITNIQDPGPGIYTCTFSSYRFFNLHSSVWLRVNCCAHCSLTGWCGGAAIFNFTRA